MTRLARLVNEKYIKSESQPSFHSIVRPEIAILWHLTNSEILILTAVLDLNDTFDSVPIYLMTG